MIKLRIHVGIISYENGYDFDTILPKFVNHIYGSFKQKYKKFIQKKLQY